MDKTLLRQIILEQWNQIIRRETGIPREKLADVQALLALPHAIVITGMRRTGKSTLLAQIIGKWYADRCYYFNFEDERLIHFENKDFQTLHEILLEEFGERHTFFFDEIQNAPGWEKFVRRMQDAGNKFFLTGSNATLLSRELGTALTGRHVTITLYPFSFREFLLFCRFPMPKRAALSTTEKAAVKRRFTQYLKDGGMPEYITYRRQEILKDVYEDILYRDIVARYELQELHALRELALYYLSNLCSTISFHRLKNILHLGSPNTVKSYTEHLKNSFLFFPVNRFSYSLKQQYIAAKKIYCLDNGLAGSIAFSFSGNQGAFLENLIFIELKRRGKEIFYYKTDKQTEVDFLAVKGKKPVWLGQVCFNLHSQKTREREITALMTTLKELSMKEGWILTNDDEEELTLEKKKIHIIPAWKWLLTP